MNTIFQVLTLAWTLSGGQYVNEALNDQGVFSVSNSSFLDLSMEVQIPLSMHKGDDNYAFVGGTNEVQQNYEGGTSLTPYRETYDAEAGVRAFGVELGYKHECVHPVYSTGSGLSTQINSSFDKFYIKVTGKI